MVTHPLQEEYFKKTEHYKEMRANRFNPPVTDAVVDELVSNLSSGHREMNGSRVVVERFIDGLRWTLVVGYDAARDPVLITVYSENHRDSSYYEGTSGKYRRRKFEREQQESGRSTKYTTASARGDD